MWTLESYVAEIVIEFIEVATHNILKTRKLYPDTIFEPKQKYGCVVYSSIHPELNEYISNCMQAAFYFAKKKQLSKVVICFTKYNEVVEKAVFDISSIKSLIEKDQYLLDTENLFRSFFVKLHYRNGLLQELLEDLSFTIQLYTTESEAVAYMSDPNFQHFPWIHVDSNYNSIPDSDMLPLLNVEDDVLAMQVYIVSKMKQKGNKKG